MTKTTFVQTFSNLAGATDVFTSLDVHCDKAHLPVNLPSVTVIDLNNTTDQEHQSMIAFPNVRELSSVGNGIPWTLYVNHVEDKRGLWNPGSYH